MRIEVRTKIGGGEIDRIVYDDIYGTSEYFVPKVWIDFWSKDKYWIKTALGDKIAVSEADLRQINMKLILQNIGSMQNRVYKRFMAVNSPRKASERIPLLSIAKKLNKIYKRSINVEREYEKRWENGFRYWCPKSIN